MTHFKSIQVRVSPHCSLTEPSVSGKTRTSRREIHCILTEPSLSPQCRKGREGKGREGISSGEARIHRLGSFQPMPASMDERFALRFEASCQ